MADRHLLDFVRAALDGMPTANLADLFSEFNYRLHINPVEKLPFELTEIIMQHISPADVIRCSVTSRTFRSRALDSQLWKDFYFREGWRIDFDALSKLTPARGHRRKHESSGDVRSSRKRHHHSSLQVGGTDDTRDWNVQHDELEADDDRRMEGIESETGEQHSTLAELSSLNSPPSSPVEHTDRIRLSEDALLAHNFAYELLPPVTPKITYGKGPNTSINWLWLYKQRRRLESNWDNGRSIPFQLPRPEHMDEAHEECVYTIQFSGNWLVSGSRDKTIKIWDLESQRCTKTLRGQHEQSVLCLQFDPIQDIIVSGGSDSYVVVWRFQDGKVIKKMTTAHSESVLNLRFDDRYLITCSKDKTIRIWNRHEIMSDDPIIPIKGRERLNKEPLRKLEPYSFLCELEGHNAAVNAIQIYENTIVSASGDRTIMMWDVETGVRLRRFDGHIKGIACVQFDGRRVVSGSSDNTVRIFDAATQGEVACLTGHTNLVRTVQARFGDNMVSDEELEKAARDAQDKWAMNIDTLSHMTPSRHALDQVHDIRALNTRIPQGGGGSRWSRIVSGSYDETVIIWKKDAKGKWRANRRLHQDEILASARNRALRHRNLVQPGNGHSGHRGPAPAPPHAGPAQAGPAQAQPHRGQPNAGQGPAQGVANQGGPAAMNPPPQPAPAQQGHRRGAGGGGRHRGAAPVAGGGAPSPFVVEENNSNRVFKLQFDARRIVCCSQNRIIVGWDFANGDKDLEEAGKYFAETD